MWTSQGTWQKASLLNEGVRSKELGVRSDTSEKLGVRSEELGVNNKEKKRSQ